MTRVHLHTDPDTQPEPVDLILSLFGVSDAASNIHIGHGFFGNGTPVPESHLRLFQLASGVFVTDRCVRRDTADDGWTRQIELSVPDSRGLGDVIPALTDMLTFLTGDDWGVTIEGAHGPWRPEHPDIDHSVDSVCLFSGGLDSFAGAIRLLEDGQRLVLVGHHDASHAATRQTLLHRILTEHYPGRVTLKQLNLDPRTGDLAKEKTQRSRSLLFLSAGMSVAGVLGDDVPLVMPENGYISLNVPLLPSRRGSASTRTTHPHFLRHFRTVAAELGVDNPVVNPFQLHTKGEVMQSVAHVDSFQEGVRDSVSCSHPDEHRWPRHVPKVNETSVNCGYCYPCLIRRAALHTVGLDRRDDYLYDAFDSPNVHNPQGQAGADLFALVSALRRAARPGDAARHGPLGSAAAEHEKTYRRGRNELLNWLQSAPASSKLANKL